MNKRKTTYIFIEWNLDLPNMEDTFPINMYIYRDGTTNLEWWNDFIERYKYYILQYWIEELDD